MRLNDLLTVSKWNLQMDKLEDLHLDEIESLLNQSLRGVHHLFDNHEIARVLSTPTEELNLFTVDHLDRVQELFSELVSHPSVSEKMDFLASLDPESYEILLRAYFQLVENTLLAATAYRH